MSFQSHNAEHVCPNICMTYTHICMTRMSKCIAVISHDCNLLLFIYLFIYLLVVCLFIH